MNNRSPLCYALDFCGLIALTGAGLALGAALWFAGSMAEAIMLDAFRYGMMAASGALVSARVVELSRIFRSAAPATATPALPDNVESLPSREHLARAA